MPKGYVDGFSKNELYADSFNQCLDKAMAAIDYERKFKEYQNQTGDVRRGIGMAVFWYNTAVWPISLESSSCRMVLNQDGSFQLQVAETEIGQGADTAFAQMAADVVGVPMEKVHVVSCQDTDVTPFGTGAYASRQTYVAGFSIRQTGLLLKERILNYAHELVRMPVFNLDIIDGNIVRTTDGRVLMSLAQVAEEALYSLSDSQHITAESTYQVKSNAYSFGCTIAEVEVDIPMCKTKLLNIVNCHDAGTLINPALAEAQVHGGMSMGIFKAGHQQVTVQIDLAIKSRKRLFSRADIGNAISLGPDLLIGQAHIRLKTEYFAVIKPDHFQSPCFRKNRKKVDHRDARVPGGRNGSHGNLQRLPAVWRHPAAERRGDTWQ